MSCGQSAPFSFQQPHSPHNSISPPASKLKASTDSDVVQGEDGPSSSSIMVKSYEKTRTKTTTTQDNEEYIDDAENDNGNEEDIREPRPASTLEKQGTDAAENDGIDVNIDIADEDVQKLRPATSEDRLSVLPDELILRIISLSGNATHQMRSAFALGNTCRRLRRVLLTGYLPSLHRFTRDTLNALGLSDRQRATSALRAALELTTSIRTLALEGPPPQVFTAGCFAALSTAAGESLRTVNLTYNYLTDDCVKPLLANCTRLEELALRSCSNMTGEAFISIGADNIRAPIKSLDLSCMHRLDVQALKAVANVSTITSIKLAGCSNVNNSALTSLTEGILKESLTHINLKCCPVDDETIIDFVTRCKKLEKLTLAKHHDNLWETGYYTEAAVMYIRERLPSVQVVIEN